MESASANASARVVGDPRPSDFGILALEPYFPADFVAHAALGTPLR